jgi:hypothetical protein
MISMDIETTFYEYLKKYAGNINELKWFNLKHISSFILHKKNPI